VDRRGERTIVVCLCAPDQKGARRGWLIPLSASSRYFLMAMLSGCESKVAEE
jgi:hypothetical protein